jgi:UDP-GlcNAc:undecaprenyl-phosphate/decaprenyl-phosphate GlcNAc-1-phosphate transferase
MESNWLALTAVFAAALLSSLLLVPLAGALGCKAGFVDRPRRGEVQAFILPRSGGYGIVAAFVVGVGVSLVFITRYPDEFPRLWGLMLGAGLLLPLALLDDWKRLSPLPQLIWQIAAACVPMAFGIAFDSLAGPFGGILPLPGLLVLPLTLVWIVGMVNTVNLTDTMDGLAGGVAAIAALVLAGVSLQNGQQSIAALALALSGATVGFLCYNFHPSRIIMGSSGSLFLGYTLGVLAIIGGAKIAAAVMVLGLPILDVAYVIASRLSRGRSPLRGGDAAHLPHRLLAMGLSQRQVALILYALCLLFGALALLLTRVEKLYGFVLLGVVALALIGFAARTQQRSQVSNGRAPGKEEG